MPILAEPVIWKRTLMNFVGFLKSCARLGGASSSKKRFRSTLSGLEPAQ